MWIISHLTWICKQFSVLNYTQLHPIYLHITIQQENRTHTTEELWHQMKPSMRLTRYRSNNKGDQMLDEKARSMYLFHLCTARALPKILMKSALFKAPLLLINSYQEIIYYLVSVQLCVYNAILSSHVWISLGINISRALCWECQIPFCSFRPISNFVYTFCTYSYVEQEISEEFWNRPDARKPIP